MAKNCTKILHEMKKGEKPDFINEYPQQKIKVLEKKLKVWNNIMT